MSAPRPAPAEIGLELSRHDLYPPLSNDSIEIVSFSTTATAPAGLTFDYTLNDQAGEAAGIWMHVGDNLGHLRIDRDFIARFAGNWPVQLAVRAWEDGNLVDSAVLRLHDTRSMVVARCEAQLGPNPVSISQELENGAAAIAAFFDAQGVELPESELDWEISLPQSHPGLVVEGKRVRVFPEAVPGDVVVRVRERSGVQQDITLTLIEAQDIGLELPRYDLYPPLRNPRPEILWIQHNLENGADLKFTFDINGKPYRTGIGLGRGEGWFEGDWAIIVENTFVTSFPGPWPAKLLLKAVVDGSIVDTVTLWLHDTKTIECAKADLELLPSAEVEIPGQGADVVVAAPRFHDANGVPLPHEELDWKASLVEPVEGVEMRGNVVYVYPEAKPGQFRVGIRCNGLNRARVVTLV